MADRGHGQEHARVYLIAELASAHDGDLGKAKLLIDLAARAGFDAAKMQFWSDANALADKRRVGEEYRAIYHRYRPPITWFPHLADRARKHGIAFGSTANMAGDVAMIAPFCDFFKVASFEMLDFELLDAMVNQKPTIVSTGMASRDELRRLVHYYPKIDTLLHCTSAYPCAPEDVNLLNISTMRALFPDQRIGFSDHTADPLAGAIAVAAGAEVIEVHIRLEGTEPDNPDYASALSPKAARQYVNNARKAEAMLGDSEKRQREAESEMANYRWMP